MGGDTKPYLYQAYIRKYLNTFNIKDSIWSNPFITFDISREEKKKYYETFLRCNPHLIEKMHELEIEVLGYWCANSKLCHGSILINSIMRSMKRKDIVLCWQIYLKVLERKEVRDNCMINS